MSDWQVGDLALCIKLGRWTCSDGSAAEDQGIIRGGGLYTVHRVDYCGDDLCLGFDVEPDVPYCADRFVKVTPPKTKQSIRTEQTA